MRHLHKIAIWSLLVVSLIACSEDEYGGGENAPAGKVYFQVGVNEVIDIENTRIGESLSAPVRTYTFENTASPMFLRSVTVNAISPADGKKRVVNNHTENTRGRMIYSSSFYDSFGFLLYDYNASTNWAAQVSTITPSIYNEEVKRERGWMTQEYWPGAAHKLTFYAYAPYNDPNITWMSPATQAGVPQLSYEVPENAINQNDLLICHNEKDVAGNYDATYGILFDHACSAVRIAVGNQMAPCRITRVELRNVYGQGDYTFGDAAWTLTGNPDYVFYLDQEFEVKKTDKNRILTTGDNVFMMLPQVLGADAELAITVDDGSPHEMVVKLDGEEWKMGTTKTYYISTSSTESFYVLSVTTPDDHTSDGGNGECEVSSYVQTFYGSQNPVPWTAEYEVNGETYNTGTPDYLYEFTNSGVGSNTGETLPFKVDWLPPRSNRSNPHTAALQDATPLGSQENPYDLSAGKQTANCYVINAPGTYSFPLVYGNARNADGSANIEAYGKDPNNPSTTFVDHANKAITSPYIYETNSGANVPNNVCIVWQDAPTLVTPDSLRLSENGDSIIFTIEKSHICQGNCLIAVRNSSNVIMWSWHIWVTDLQVTPSNTVEFKNLGVGGDVTSHLIRKPLGYCDEDNRVSSPREFTIKVTQNVSGGQNASVTFTQAGGTYYSPRSANFYQWGRKDPFVGANNSNGARKKLYDNWYGQPRSWSHVATNVAIQNPYRFYCYTAQDWSSVHKLDYWNVGTTATNINNDEVIKSIYDPSPSGFEMIKGAAFTGWTITGTWTKQTSDFNVIGVWNDGWNIRTNVSGEQSLFFPLFGYLEIGQTKYGLLEPSQTGAWTANPGQTSGNNNRGFATWFQHDAMWGYSMDQRAYGACIWSTIDE